MVIKLTLSEVLHKCPDFLKFCKDKGISEWACAEGFGYTEVSLTEEEAFKYGILKKEV